MTKKINKSDLIKLVSKKLGKKETEIIEIVDALFDEMRDNIVKENIVQILGFGQFDVIERRERNATNPRTGEMIKVPAKKSVRFKKGTLLNV